MTDDDQEKEILVLAIDAISKHLNDLIFACIDDKGQPIAPTKQAIAKARGCLPAKYSMSFQAK